ncbi:MAG: glycosyltransferase family 4 protein [Rhizobiaceae bacterium]|nr:glycosyltransferase family 4 protein [Rhizobiaceae bacterium]
MRIAFHAPMKPLGSSTPSGDGRMAELFAEALRQGGADVATACRLRSYDQGDPARQARLETLGVRFAGKLIEAYRMKRLPSPDLWFTYHLYHKAPDLVGPLVTEALGIPYVVAEASFAPKRAGGKWDVGHRAAERAIRAADRIHCLNPADAACLEPLLHSPAVLKDLAPFIDTAPFAASAMERAAARRETVAAFDFSPNAPILLTVAMMRQDQKLASYRVLADALERLVALDWSLLVVGAGPAEAEVRALFAPFGHRIGFAGLRKGRTLAGAYAASDIFVWPAVKEAFGVAFIEAASAGLAIVAGRSGGIAHIVEDGRTGLVVDAGDAAATAGALRRLLADPSEMRGMGEAGALRAASINDIGAAAQFLADDLAGVVRRHEAGRGR